MPLVSLEDYRKLIADRPVKFSPDEVGYRSAYNGGPQCHGCLHFFERRLDKFGVCEIMRSKETDEDGVNPKWTCRFNTIDMQKFPLLEEK